VEVAVADCIAKAATRTDLADGGHCPPLNGWPMRWGVPLLHRGGTHSPFALGCVPGTRGNTREHRKSCHFMNSPAFQTDAK
jgi:hypothetical protein